MIATHRRLTARGSVVGVGLLLATSAMTGPALAGPTDSGGNGKNAPPSDSADGDTGTPGAPLNDLPQTGTQTNGGGNGNGDGTGNGNGTGNGAANGNGVGDGTGNGNGAGNGNGNGSPEEEVPGDDDGIVPDFGLGKNYDVDRDIRISPTGPVPADLDLAGATFTLTSLASPAVSGTCTTGSDGVCTVVETGFATPGPARVVLPPGAYSIAQTSAPAGLAANGDDLGTFVLCGFWAECVQGGTLTVSDASLFRTSVVTTVTDWLTGDPVTGADYRLTGPDYPHVGVPFVAGAVHDAGTATGDIDGSVTHAGWFLPGTWTLTAGDPPAGYLPDPPSTTDIATTAVQALALEPWIVARALDRIPVTPEEDDGDTGGEIVDDPGPLDEPDPVDDPADDPAPINPAPNTGGAGPVVPAGPVLTGTATRRDSGTPPVTDTDPPVDEPGPSTDSIRHDGRTAGGGAAPSTGGAVVLDAEPALETVSSSFSEVGLLGFGVLLVAAVLVGTRVVMRRARRGA